MMGFKEKLHDLSWVGMPDKGWFEITVTDEEILTKENKKIVDTTISKFLEETLSKVALDNDSITKQELSMWIDYRQKLKEIPLQPGYPNNVFWPKRPDVE